MKASTLVQLADAIATDMAAKWDIETCLIMATEIRAKLMRIQSARPRPAAKLSVSNHG